MVINRPETTKLIIDFRDLFFQIIDEIDLAAHDQRVSEEFTVSRYNYRLAAAVRHLPTREQTRALDALCVENLARNKLLVFNHGQSGRFLLVGWIIEMLRSFEDSRLKGLTQPDLDHLHVRLESVRSQLKDPTLIWDDGADDFREVIATLYACFHDVAHQLNQNVQALKGRCDALSHVVDTADYESLDRSQQVSKALDDIYKIHQRNVVPTIQFLDPSLDIKRPVGGYDAVQRPITRSPMRIMREIIDRFEESERTGHVRQLQRIYVQLLTLSKVVVQLRGSLEQYVRLRVEQRRRYNIIEERYNRLREAVVQRQDGSLRGFRLKVDDPLFSKARFFAGLKLVMAPTGGYMWWPEEGLGRSYLDESIRVALQAREEASNEVGKRQAESEAPEVDANSLSDERRAAALNRAVESFPAPEEGADLYLALHQHLATHMEEYELADVLEGAVLLGLDLSVSAQEKNQIIYEGWVLDYYVPSLPAAAGERA